MRPLPAALAALLASGFTFMALELLFLRELQLTLGGTLYASSAMLASVMLGLFLGSQLFGRLSRTAKDPGALFLRLELALAAAAILILPALRALGSIDAWAPRFILSFLVILLPSMLAGGELPLALRFLEPSIEKKETGYYGGLVYGADTLGGLLGALAVPFLLLPALGALRSAWCAAAVETVGALVLWSGLRAMRPGAAIASVALGGLLAGLASRGDALDLKTASWSGPPPIAGLKLGWLHDSPYQRLELFGDLSREASDANPKVLRLDGVVQSAVPFHPAYRESVLLSLLGRANPERVLVIGCGDGDQLAVVLSDPRVRRVDQVELDASVGLAARAHLAAAADVGGRLVWDDPRLKFRLGDGRRFLAETDEKWDLILADLPHAAHEGAAAFYSAEFFGLARTRLKDGGVFLTHVYRPDENEHGGRERLLSALLIAGTTAASVFPEVRLVSPWLDPSAHPDAWPAHWLLASAAPLAAGSAEAEKRIAGLRPLPRWMTAARYRALMTASVDPRGFPGWPVSTDDRPAILFPDRWSHLPPARP